MIKKIFLIVLGLIFFGLTSALTQANQYGNHGNNSALVLKKQSPTAIEISYSMPGFTLQETMAEGEMMKSIIMDAVFLPNQAGAPNLPVLSQALALPEGARAKIKVKEIKYEIIKDIRIAPAPAIPLETERQSAALAKDPEIYSRDAYYPSQPVQLSEISEIRGVDIVMLGLHPFQYNPVKRELKVLQELEIEIQFTGGSNKFGEDRLRSRWFDPILRQTLLNFESLPQVDYSKRTCIGSNKDNVGCEYLIVIPNDPAWYPYAAQIKDFRIKQGISTDIITLDEIGGSTADELEDFFNTAFNTWDIPPVAVLLMADYGSDPANSIISPLWNYYCVSDNIYADVNYNNLPDIIFARMTAQNTSHLQTMVSKMIDYETNPPMDYNFYHKPITALGWQTERWFQLCSETVGGFWREVEGKSPLRINDIFEGIPGSIWSTAQNTSTVVNYFGPGGVGYIPASPMQLGGWAGGNAQMVAAAVNDGAFALQHRDHGYEYGWGEPGFTSSSINMLQNNQNNEFPFVFSINCLTGKYNIQGECFTEKFHRYTYNGLNAGALGLIAASETSYSFVNDVYVWGMFDFFYPDFLPDYGPYVNGGGFLPAFGNAAGMYFLHQSAWPYNTGNKEVTYHLFHHHGGAFLSVYSEVPQSLTVNHDSTVYNYQGHLTVQADAGTLIALSHNDNILALGESAGNPIDLTFEPLTAGSELHITLTKQNYLRYENTVEIIAPEGAFIVFDSVEINDAGAIIENGKLDYAEQVKLNIGLKNIGSQAAEAITAILSSTDPYIAIVQNNASFSSISSNSVVFVPDAFALEVSEDIPDGHSINFEINASDGSSSWTSTFSITAQAPEIQIQKIIVEDITGNNDGFLDPGETAPVKILLINNGHSAAFSLTGILATSDTSINILNQNPQIFGDLWPGQTKAASLIVAASAYIQMPYTAETIFNLTSDFGLSFQIPINFEFKEYCIPAANCAYGDGFRSFSLLEINNTNNGCSSNGYGDFTHTTATLEAGATYTVNWKGGFSNQRASLWIDLNSNKAFEPAELLIADFLLASSTVAYTTDFTLPGDISPGNKRLRIRAQYQNSSANPCADFSYGETEDYTVIFPHPEPSLQVISLPEGWSGLSTYLMPSNPQMETLFEAVLDNLLIVQNMEGIFWPEQSVNTLGIWNPYAGYLIKTSSEIELTISGQQLVPAHIQLKEGWNIMAILSPCEVSSDALFSDTFTNLVLIKEVAGTGIFWPVQGINTLPVLYPGKSYFVLMATDLILEFDPCSNED